MRKKSPPLTKTNPYLRNPVERDIWLNRSVMSSSAIEGVHNAARRALGISSCVKALSNSVDPSESSQSHR